MTDRAAPTASRAVDFGARSHVGRTRTGNEDRFLARPPLFVVADGMGGHQAGEVAAALAVELLAERLDAGSAAAVIATAIEEANRSIWERARNSPDLDGMGTTCTVALLDGVNVHLAHVGDSRAYRLRGGRLTQLTEDHTLIEAMVREGLLSDEEARDDDRRHIVTRALGAEPRVRVDASTVALETGDRLLLCSDGLSGQVDDETIASVLAATPDPRAAVDRLVDLANAAGGRDNVTVIVVDPDAAAPAPAGTVPVDLDAPTETVAVPAAARREPRRSRLPALVALVALIALGIAAVAFGLNASGLLAPAPSPSPSPSSSATPTPSPSVAPSGPPRPSVSPSPPAGRSPAATVGPSATTLTPVGRP